MQDLGIVVFGHTRALLLADTLESLKKQNSLEFVDLWIDGDQGVTDLKRKVSVTHRIVEKYNVGTRNFHRGHLGFRKLILLAMQQAVQKYKYIIFLEDDCFPSRNAINTFTEELKSIEDEENVFSVYGHHFLMAEDTGLCSRFQGWGWATTSRKLKPYLDKLISCYSMHEKDYLAFVEKSLTPEVIKLLDVTPPRLPTHTLRNFFAWDETMALLTALDGKLHKPTRERVIYNCGMGEGSSRFGDFEKFTKPPFNIVPHKDVWKYF